MRKILDWRYEANWIQKSLDVIIAKWTEISLGSMLFGVKQIIGTLLALAFVIVAFVVVVALMTGSKVVWSEMECDYIGFWAEGIDINKKFIVLQICSD